LYPKIVMLRPDLLLAADYVRQSFLGDGKLRAPGRGVLVAYETEGPTRRAWWLARHDRVFQPDGPYRERMPAEAVTPPEQLLAAARTALAVEQARPREPRS
jgi:hypothetical protein